jgi:hypothetical protein
MQYSFSSTDAARVRVAVVATAMAGGPIGFLLGVLQQAHGRMLLVWLAGGAVVGAVVAWLVIHLVTGVIGEVAGRLLMPTGGSSPAVPDYSYQDALVARGEVEAALRSYESLMVEAVSPTLMLRAADLYAGSGRDAARATLLYRRARDLPGCTRAQDLYASNRLIELHLATPGEERRALTELRRLADRWPGTPEGEQARAAIMRVKETLSDVGH